MPHPAAVNAWRLLSRRCSGKVAKRTTPGCTDAIVSWYAMRLGILFSQVLPQPLPLAAGLLQLRLPLRDRQLPQQQLAAPQPQPPQLLDRQQLPAPVAR